MQGKRDLT